MRQLPPLNILLQKVDLSQNVEEVKEIKELFKEKERKFEQEICLLKKESEAIADKLGRVTKELGFKRAELGAVASGGRTNLDKLRKAEEKLKAVTYNEGLNSEKEKQNHQGFFFRLIRDGFIRSGKKKDGNDDKIHVVVRKKKPAH